MLKIHHYFILLVSICCLGLSILFLSGLTEDETSSITRNDHVAIASCDDLIMQFNNPASNKLDASFILVNDIDCTGQTFYTTEIPFTGIFDGSAPSGSGTAQYTISNLTITANPDQSLLRVGLFSTVKSFELCKVNCSAKIKNISFHNIKIISDSSQTAGGLLAAEIKGTEKFPVEISNIIFNADLSEVSNTTSRTTTGTFGGLVGNAEYVKFENIALDNVRVNVDQRNNRGLIAGEVKNASFKRIYSSSPLKLEGVYHDTTAGLLSSGGIVGRATTSDFDRIHLKNTLTLQRNGTAGGIAGTVVGQINITRAEIQNLKGIPGYSEDCQEHTSLCGMGGLIGRVTYFLENSPNYIDTAINIDQSVVKGSIESEYNMGGLISYIEAIPLVSITDSYTMVKIYGKSYSQYAGGLIGRAFEAETRGPIYLKNVFATGAIGNIENANGIIGHVYGKGSIRIEKAESSFFDKNSTGKNSAGDNYSQPKSDYEMKDPSTFGNFDPSIWTLVNGKYPLLKYENTVSY